MTDILETLAQLSVLIFVIGSMMSMGLTLTLPQITAPLKNARLVILALVANFILVPALAYGITLLFSLDEPIEIGLILLSTAAGAPFATVQRLLADDMRRPWSPGRTMSVPRGRSGA